MIVLSAQEEQCNSLKRPFLAAVFIHNTHGNTSSRNKLTQKAVYADVTLCNMTLTVTCSEVCGGKMRGNSFY